VVLAGVIFGPFLEISEISDFSGFRGVRFSGFGGSGFLGFREFRGVEKRSKKCPKTRLFVKKGGLSIVTHFYIVRRFSGGVFLGWGSFGVWGKSDFSCFLTISDPFLETPKPPDPPQNHPTPRPHPPLPVYIYIYRERERERERHGLGDFWGWVFLWVFRRVGSARSQLFMPGLHHAHTLQHTKSIC